MNQIRVKMCGITRAEDAVCAAQLGVDAIGLVFFSGSKRCVNIEQAIEIVKHLPPFVSVVALFVNESAAKIREILAQVPIDVLQFHGDETPEFCQQFQRPYLKAVRVKSVDDIQAAWRDYAAAKAVLFDAFVEGVYGGTGHCFDWTMLPENPQGHWILSGGLNPDNVAQALQITGATTVDVSSGVESAAGIKSHEKMAQFMRQIRGFQAVSHF
ncbi:phosphoribosylanthranilate isomerase [Alysiella filiformis]|uniref:N-(5'-phosphoribosyl)anthranilate isomerase n=1 Tax=Alysiella filiformis DSM 16848 TaxID=1120981 RepID=A0A286E3Y4_9NEIS|nr:phosphoribosylanthranilate isomerase [Alysiella filiformis]QMT31032.1 phosphoribosylanthranilate isomerase [Alysiella filiformis]UBQ55979.1 phosphoribosylanthranilate isomerase [Alysiella filiformis DSM 16848]SOD65628.1 phosphoribosylanthranilate isomerase [Alysiella filiformis DSM 16848]